MQAIIEGSPENFHYHKAFDCKQRNVFPPNCKDEPSVKQTVAIEAAAEQLKPKKQDDEEFKVLDEVEGDEDAPTASEVEKRNLMNNENESQNEDLSSINLDTSEEWDSEAKSTNFIGNSAVPIDHGIWKQDSAIDANNLME